MSSGSAADSDIGGLFAAIDAQDGAAFVGYLTEDAIFRYGSAPPAQGREAVQAVVFEYEDEHIAEYKIYIDIAPLYAN